MSKNNINNQVEQEKAKLLNEFLKNAAFDGWSYLTLQKSANNLGFVQDYDKLLFPDGMNNFTDYFYQHTSEQMTQIFLKAKENQNIKVREKIALLLEIRLELYKPYKESIRSLLSYNMWPQNLISAQLNIWKVCDQIWHLAGDTATDFNHYSKRALLEGVYTSVILFWLSDNSNNYIETKDFITKQIENALQIGKFSASLFSRTKNFFGEFC